jgi:DNA-binding response OmpR family regulator
VERTLTPEVLIVEDDRALARSVAAELDAAGYATRSAHDGVAALAELRRQPPWLVLLDLLLPRRDGFALLEELRRLPASPPVPAIAMSGVYRTPAYARAVWEAGARSFLQKPFGSQQLLAAIEAVIGRGDLSQGSSRGPVLDLAVRPVADVIWEAVEAEMSGVLHFRSPQDHKRLLLTCGDVRAVRSKRGAPRISVEDEIQRLFEWTAGEAWLQPGIRELPGSAEVAHWSVDDAMFTGAHRMPRPLLERILEPYRGAEVLVDAGNFDASTQGRNVLALFARLVPGTRVGEVDAELLPALYAAWRTGRIHFGAPAGMPGTPSGLLERRLSERLEELSGAHRFQALGLPAGASRTEVEQAYQRLRAEYEPLCSVAQPRRIRELAARLLEIVRGAHAVLCDDLARERYAAHLGDPNSDRTVTRVACAEADFRRAEELVKRRAYAEALETLERVIEREPEVAEYTALHGWCLYLVHRDDPRAVKRALSELKTALDADRACASAPYFLALIYKAHGRLDAAHSLARRALEREPGHAGARRELRLLESRSRRGS